MQHHSTTARADGMNDVLTSARLEVLVVIWRIREALQAMPQPPSELTLRRWNHGIARELVSHLPRRLFAILLQLLNTETYTV